MEETANAPGSANWFSAVEAPERAEAGAAWDAEADLVVVGCGGAGLAAALEGAERGLSVLALDRTAGGGSTAINGGILYAGGGTAVQKQAGVEDTPEAMFQYLRGDTQGVVADATLLRFCNESAAMVDWLMRHGVHFEARKYEPKTSYPPPGYTLYHSDSSLAAARAAAARPAPRGHKAGVPSDSTAATGFGNAFTDPMRASAERLGVKFAPYSEVRRLVVDGAGRVTGCVALQFEPGSAAQAQYAKYQALATKFVLMLPPAFPGARLTLAIAGWYQRKARALEAQRVPRRIRARRGVCLAAGGFVFNPEMVRHYAPKYLHGMPLGNPYDDGSGIRLGQSVGGAAARLSHLSAWRFIRPPAGLSWGPMVNGRGARFGDECVYGAAIGYELIEHNEGRAFIIFDQPLYEETLEQLRSRELYSFQKGPALLALKFARRKAESLDALAAACGFDLATFGETIAAYNSAAAGTAPDAFGKSAEDMRPIARGPFYAIDVSVTSRLFPLPILSLGGLVVDEDTGAVRRGDGTPIAGLYAAGRNAVGVCSHLYVSGLSVADCIFSGRRAAASAAATGAASARAA
jgi:3-oxo-5alpha-steroid 4-dehydrogenase